MLSIELGQFRLREQHLLFGGVLRLTLEVRFHEAQMRLLHAERMLDACAQWRIQCLGFSTACISRHGFIDSPSPRRS